MWTLGCVIATASVAAVLGFLIGRREGAALKLALESHERTLREAVVPVVELRARELGVTFMAIPPPGPGSVIRPDAAAAATIRHLENLCKGVSEKERTVGLALSDTVQIQKSDLGPLPQRSAK